MELNIRERLGGFIASSRRVLIIAKKPTWQEFQTMAKVTGIGIVIIAAIGCIIYLFFALAGLGA